MALTPEQLSSLAQFMTRQNITGPNHPDPPAGATLINTTLDDWSRGLAPSMWAPSIYTEAIDLLMSKTLGSIPKCTNII